MNAPTEMNIEVVSPARSLAKVVGKSLSIPGRNGYLGILPGHAALVTELGLGELKIDSEAKASVRLLVNGGYMEVVNDQIIVLVDSAESRDQIDIERAKNARDRALSRLSSKDPSIDVIRAQAALSRANARISFAG
jgi:F-type H+-transporting ATPase subunit epsilon